MSLILQKHGEVEGWILESDGFFDTGNFRAKLPTRICTKGHGSIEVFFSQVLMGGFGFFFFFLFFSSAAAEACQLLGDEVLGPKQRVYRLKH